MVLRSKILTIAGTSLFLAGSLFAKPANNRIFHYSQFSKSPSTKAYLPTIGPGLLRMERVETLSPQPDSTSQKESTPLSSMPSASTPPQSESEVIRNDASDLPAKVVGPTPHGISATPDQDKTSASALDQTPLTPLKSIPTLEEFLPYFQEPRKNTPQILPEHEETPAPNEIRFIPARPVERLPSSEASYKQVP